MAGMPTNPPKTHFSQDIGVGGIFATFFGLGRISFSIFCHVMVLFKDCYLKKRCMSPDGLGVLNRWAC